jgi:zinc protease
VDSYAGNNSFGLNLEDMRDDFKTGVTLLADLLLHPALPAAPLEREREVQLAGIRAQKDQLLQRAFRAFRRSLFGSQGYGLDTHGDETSVRSLCAATLRTFHSRLVTPHNAVIALYGDVKCGEARAAIERAFARWRGPVPSGIHPSAENTAPLQRRASEVAEKKQAVVVLGFPGTRVTSPDRFALELLRESCSDLGSRLFLRVREKLGLAYYVGAQNLPGLIPGYFAFYAGTAPETAERVEQEFVRETELLRADGLSAEELTRAKAKIIGQRKIARQDLGQQALTQALDELYGLGHANADAEDARYEAVTLDDVRAAANTYLRPELSVVAIVGGQGPKESSQPGQSTA